MMVIENSAKPAHKRERTCAGCGEKADAAGFVRLVLGPACEIAVDAAGGGFGRGAHVHGRFACLAKACRGGLSRAFKVQVQSNAEALAIEVSAAFLRRADGLLLAARRAGATAQGADEARSALASGAPLVVVAVDAGSVVQRSEIARAIAEGRACAWSTKSELGRMLGREEVAVCAVTDARMAAAIVMAVSTADGARSGVRVDATSESGLQVSSMIRFADSRSTKSDRGEGAEQTPSAEQFVRRSGEEDR